MKVFIVTEQGYDETVILGVFATKELAQEHIDWCNDTFKGTSQYDIVEETVVGA
jgi:tripartite-type tricarboxylate transporter receptor subunit TctC